MSKRAIYSIPLAGLALTTFGCPGEEPPPPVVDELVNSFQVDVFNGYASPGIYADSDVSAAQDGSVICTVTYSNTDITFNADLVGTTVYTAPQFTDCVDANGAPADPALIPPDVLINITLTATVVTLNEAYSINLTDDQGNSQDLACTLANGVVDCGGVMTLSQL